MLLLAAHPAAVFAQAASLSETNAVARIAECLVVGAPPDWQKLHMVIELAEPGAESGQVRYLAVRESSPDTPVPYVPCDLKKPAQVLIESRQQQVPERKGWTGARLTLHETGKFELNYDYPK
ncbi:MAG TPA: hypothetical protein VFK84_19465 [Burkholderiales bacterium]|nr:hypothetical protein [Burkholderiales bacterium]